MEIQEFDLIEPIAKNSYLLPSIKDAVYMYFGGVKSLDSKTGEWVDSCMYREWSKESDNCVGDTFIIKKELFLKYFKTCCNEASS